MRNLRLLIADFYNRLDYPLRQAIRWRRGSAPIQNQPKDGLYRRLPPYERQKAEQTARRLLESYHLQTFYEHSQAENYAENLFYLAMLESALEKAGSKLGDQICAADIGPSTWFYVQALFALLRWYAAPQGRKVQLIGFECDAYRLYSDLRSRLDHARMHIRDLEQVEYLAQAFSPQPGRFDLIFMLFPFIFLEDHLQWGIPARYFAPSSLLQDAWVSLKSGGILILVNQGENEQRAQLHLLEQVNIPLHDSYPFHSNLFSYDLQRYVTLAVRRS